MKRLALLPLLLTLAACPAKPPARPTAAAPASRPSPDRPFDYQVSTLANGMRVITLEDHSTPIAAVQVWYHVGSKDDRPDRRGFAHMFEHMMFRGTANIGPKAHFEYVHRVGGQNNAYTSFDNTTYIQEVPSSQVEMVLWLEAERMGFLKINQGYFDTERQVVAEERRMAAEQPYGTLLDRILPELFTGAYRWSPIGDAAELDAASADELQAYWNTYYVPNNATLVVVGDVTHEAILALAERYFGWFPRYPEPPQASGVEPEQTAAKLIRLDEKNGPAPIVGLIYRTVPTGHPDELALAMLGQILGQGESSRLYLDLVSERELAMFAVAAGFSLEDTGLFAAGAVLPVMGGKPDLALAALREHIARIQKEGVTEVELDKARNGALRQAISEQRFVEAKATALGEAAVIKKDLESVNTRFARIRAVSAADVQRVAATYLVAARENELRVQPSLLGFIAKQMGGGAAATRPADTGEISGPGEGKPGLLRPATLGAKPPVAPPLAPRLAATTAERVLANGLRVVVIPNREVPFVAFRLGLEYGAFADPAEAPGAAATAAQMLTRGAGGRSYAELAEELDRYAIEISGGADLDTTMVEATTVGDHADRALGLLATVVREPSFPADELKKFVAQARTARAIVEKSPEYAADRELRRRLFPGHPYARLAEGESADLDKLTSPTLLAWWQAHCRPDAAVLFVAGDLGPEAAFALAERHLGSWRAAGAKPAIAVPALPSPAPTRIYLVDRAGAQAQIRVGQLGVTRRHPAWFRARLLSEIFGGSFNARLNDRIRVKEGLTYGAWGGFTADRFAGRVVAGTFTKNATVGQAVLAILDEIRRLERDPPTAAEVADSRSYLLGSFVGARESPEAIAADLWQIVVEGLPATYFDDFLAAIAKITGAEAAATARELLDPDHLVIVVVGPAAELKPQLEKIAPVEVL